MTTTLHQKNIEAYLRIIALTSTPMFSASMSANRTMAATSGLPVIGMVQPALLILTHKILEVSASQILITAT